MIRNEKPIAIIFNQLSRTIGDEQVYKAINTETAEFVGVISRGIDLADGAIITLDECLSTPEDKTPAYTLGEVLSFNDLRGDEKAYVKDALALHERKMKYLDDISGTNVTFGRLRARFASKETLRANSCHFRPKPQGLRT
tara:strand:- start:277 stop:696 length:420 start_codon:yes stop_codon:yes gene_type:complete